MNKNSRIDFKEVERLSKFGGADNGADNFGQDRAVTPVVSASLKFFAPAISAVTTFLACNRSWGWGCKKKKT